MDINATTLRCTAQGSLGGGYGPGVDPPPPLLGTPLTRVLLRVRSKRIRGARRYVAFGKSIAGKNGSVGGGE